ncbi:MAG: D-alanine--D-alanine ligase [Candidatus Omnitrophica bacterium]|nr:D-alanine--D-alanine ligase [Candidatus Omnitrophota bacterium]
MPFDFYSEFDSPATLEAISGALRAAGHEVLLVEADESLPRWFFEHPVDLVFNIAEGTGGRHRESQVPAILESLGVPFTGSGSTTLSLALDKARTKQLLAYEGIPTPAWQVFRSPDDPLDPRLQFPLIVKPNREGSAKGIMRENVVQDASALRRQVRRVFGRYRQEVLVEEFIDGLELTVGVLGNDVLQALPILEIDFAGCERSGEFFYSWRMKEYEGNKELGLDPAHHCPARLPAATAAAVQRVALRVHRALGCRDLSRTDIRLRRDGTPFVLEINPLPGLSPQDSNFPIMTTAAGIAYPALITHLVGLALARYRQGAQPHELSPLAVSRSAP